MYVLGKYTGYNFGANNINLGYTEYVDSALGYDADVNNTILGYLDYIPSSNWGYHRNAINIALGYVDYVLWNYSTTNYINTNDGRIDYLYRNSFYSKAAIEQYLATTWDTWAENWEFINTNWES